MHQGFKRKYTPSVDVVGDFWTKLQNYDCVTHYVSTHKSPNVIPLQIREDENKMYDVDTTIKQPEHVSTFAKNCENTGIQPAKNVHLKHELH